MVSSLLIRFRKCVSASPKANHNNVIKIDSNYGLMRGLKIGVEKEKFFYSSLKGNKNS